MYIFVFTAVLFFSLIYGLLQNLHDNAPTPNCRVHDVVHRRRFAGQVDAYTLPFRRGRRTTEAGVATKDDGTSYQLRRVAVESTIELVGDDGEVVGEAPGIQIKLYGG